MNSSSSAWIFGLLCGYILVAQYLRKRRLQEMRRKFADGRSFASVNLDEASHIQRTLSDLEFPFMYLKALQFALFRTYGIPSISHLLVQTQQLLDPATASKRYVDTEVLIAEFCGNHPQSKRAIDAIARMNFIHSIYRKSGKISDDDMLYTLSLFALEPVRWINRYEWRELEDFEKNAIGTFWKAMGDAMDIAYDQLPQRSDGGWENGLQWLQTIEAWAEKYEERTMVPSRNNHQTAERTMALLLWYVPKWAQSFAKQLVYTLMDQRLRLAMLYEQPSSLIYGLSSTVLLARTLFLRYLALPRPSFLAKSKVDATANRHGRFYFRLMDAAPYYIEPTWWARYGPFSWLTRWLSLPLPGDDETKYYPTGFATHEVGPQSLKASGRQYMAESSEGITTLRMNRCPFA